MTIQPEAYERVVSVIEKCRGSNMSVPDLSKLLGVKPTTLNARFRREHIRVQTVGRTNYIPYEQARRLAELHKYALFGWPTLQEASALTTVKDGTLKAQCEKGKLEGHIDLTKRLRLNPTDLERLKSCRAERVSNASRKFIQTHAQPHFIPKPQRSELGKTGLGSRVPAPKKIMAAESRLGKMSTPATPRNGSHGQISFSSRLLPIPPAPEPRIQLITRKNYGLPEVEESPKVKERPAKSRALVRERAPWLDYLPEQPFSISECSVGRAIHYGPHDGTIVKLIDDPFTPKILVNFPEHPHPVMREVQLLVGRRKIKP